MNLFLILMALSCLNYIYCEKQCSSFKTCGECIGHSADTCVWCAQPSDNINERCQSASTVDKNWCPHHIVNPSPQVDLQKKNEEFSSTVQFRPQQVVIKARPGVVIPFQVSYKPAEDFPVDVYFLLDNTYTMKKHKEALQRQALDIYNKLLELTKNVRLGVGTFVEKPALPYMDVKIKSTTHYTFINHLPLTKDTALFQTVIKDGISKFGSNYDDAEASLDALMQVLKCETELGWRKNTRRIVMVATDNTYHSAGNGKMVGTVKPNDMKCRLVNNEYRSVDALTYDYPSVSQINKAAVEGKFLIIFAATKNFKDVYEKLSNLISGSQYAELKGDDRESGTGTHEENESYIMEIIRKAYQESVASVKLDKIASDNFEIHINQTCEKNNFVNCQSSPLNPVVTIPITVKSKKCGATENIVIYPIGLEDKLNIQFIVDCQCECEKNASKVKSLECNNNGIMQCGACKCDEKRSGKKCEYFCSDAEAQKLQIRCLPANNPNATVMCNHHGHCVCGNCICESGYTGNVCEYSPDSCGKASNGEICSGPSRGVCEYGKCTCLDETYGGDTCDCLMGDLAAQKCYEPFSKKICSGRGYCACGKCICNKVGDTEEKYLGTFCDFCKDCAAVRCKELEKYAVCNHDNSKEHCNEVLGLGEDFKVDVLVAERSHLRELEEWKKGTQCRTTMEDGKFLVFKYATDHTQKSALLLRIQKELEIPPEPELLVPIAGSIIGILLIGLLTLLVWKVLINMYDKREYQKFCDEAKAQGFDVSQNPLYEPPTQNFVNPVYCENIN